jgi:hypothetical protein
MRVVDSWICMAVPIESFVALFIFDFGLESAVFAILHPCQERKYLFVAGGCYRLSLE